MSAPHDDNRIDWRVSLPRAAFLACSWTWCIGMYFPVILVREFGWPGWVAFAVPNVVGAAWMGIIFRARGASEAFVARHERAMRAFSLVTIAFHAFFLAWIGARFFAYHHRAIVRDIAGPTLAIGCVAAGAVGALFPSRLWWALAPVAWLASCALLAAMFVTGRSHFLWPQALPEGALGDLALAAPVMAFGFLLCPALDLTFHRVRRETPGRTGDAAFVLGFGVCFLAMIVGSLLYAQGMLTHRWWSFALVAHLAGQSVFTIGAHARELAPGRPARAAALLAGPALVGVGLALASGAPAVRRTGLTGESVYMCFLGLYALAFPALVWVYARRADWSPRRRRRGLIGWAIACALGAPALWLGFVEHDYIWLAPGLGAALLSRPLAGVLARRAP